MKRIVNSVVCIAGILSLVTACDSNDQKTINDLKESVSDTWTSAEAKRAEYKRQYNDCLNEIKSMKVDLVKAKKNHLVLTSKVKHGSMVYNYKCKECGKIRAGRKDRAPRKCFYCSCRDFTPVPHNRVSADEVADAKNAITEITQTIFNLKRKLNRIKKKWAKYDKKVNNKKNS